MSGSCVLRIVGQDLVDAGKREFETSAPLYVGQLVWFHTWDEDGDDMAIYLAVSCDWCRVARGGLYWLAAVGPAGEQVAACEKCGKAYEGLIAAVQQEAA